MKIIGFNHCQLDSEDVERTRAFYEALGGKVTQTMVRNNGSWVGYQVEMAPGLVVEIQPPRLPREKGGFDGWGHLAFQVDSCEEACQAVVDAGGKMERGLMNNMMGTQAIINCVVLGTEGEKIELIQYV